MEGLRNNTVQYVPGVLKISKALILSPEDYDKLAEDISPEYPFLKLEQYLQFPITRLKPPHSFEYLFYEYAPPRKNPALEGLSGLSWPGPQCRWCTARLKTRIIDRYLRELKKEFESLLAVGRKHLCQLSTLRWQQRDGLDTVLPYGVRRIHALRTLTTESVAVLMPFKAQELNHTNGIYYGQNAVSGNMIRIDRAQLLNGHSFRLGVSGSGKSMSAKEELVEIALRTKDDILILDPESEFGRLVKALGGEVLPISPHSSIHLNALDIDRAYGEGKNPLVDKVKLILSIFEPLTENGLTAKQRSILDRCARLVYREYIRGGYRGAPPTLVDLRRILLEQPEAEAHDLALASELYTTGSLNIFAHQTNVDTGARILCYDIRELDEQLRPVGMVVTLDAIFNRVIRNWRQGKRTWILADEFYILFRYSFSAEFFYRLFKRMRKYNAFITAISQNVDEILRSDTARLMLANSELLVMLNQAATDREELAKLLNISENQLSYITNVPAGHGIIRCGGAIIPFENSFPKNTKLYRLMTTKPDETF